MSTKNNFVSEHVTWNHYGELFKKENERKHARILWILIAMILVLGLGILFIFSYYYYNQCYTNYQVLTETERSDSNNVTYQYFKDGLLKYSQSGISLIDSDGTPLWNGGFEMKQIQVDVSGDKVLAADITGTSFHVYNGKDEGMSMETTYPIVRAKISEKGIVAALEQDTDSNILRVYNPYSSTKSLILDIPTNVAEEGYPMDFDISPDGKTIVTSYMVVESSGIKNRVNFYNFSDVGKDNNELVGSKEYGTSVISNIDFIGEDKVIIFHEEGYDIFSNMKQPVPDIQNTYKDPIVSVAYNDKYVAVVTDSSSTKKILHVSTVEGEKLLEREFNYDYSYLDFYGDELFFGGGHNCHVFRMNGMEKVELEVEEEVDGFFPTGRSTEYILIDKNTIKKIRLMSR